MTDRRSRRRKRADELADELEQLIHDLERVSTQLTQELRYDNPSGTVDPA